MIKDLTWKHVAIIAMFFGTLALLTMTGHETGAFVAIGVGVLAALGLMAVQTTQAKEQTTAVKEQTNGNHTRALDIIEAQGRMLAAMHPVAPPATPPTEPTDPPDPPPPQ